MEDMTKKKKNQKNGSLSETLRLEPQGDMKRNSKKESEKNSKKEEIMDDESKKLRILFIGDVSGGKTTLLNSIHSTRLDDMQKQNTTASVNIYRETRQKSNDANKIYEDNRKYEAEVKNKKQDEIKICEYSINLSKNFGEKTVAEKGNYLEIVDTPGLNDGCTGEATKKWITENFNTFQIIFLVVDVNSGLRTTTERATLNFLAENISKNTHVILVSIINKCDNPEDEETIASTKEAEKIIEEVMNMNSSNSITVSMSAEIGYMYRYVETNKNLKGLSTNQKQKLIQYELGSKAKNLSEEELVTKIIDSIKETKNDSKSVYTQSNYELFINKFWQATTKAIDNYVMRRKNHVLNGKYDGTELNSLEAIFKNYDEIHRIEQDNKQGELLSQYFVDCVNKYLAHLEKSDIKIDASINNVTRLSNNYKDLITKHYHNFLERLISFYKNLVRKTTVTFNAITETIVKKFPDNIWLNEPAILEILKDCYDHFNSDEKKVCMIRFDKDETTMLQHPSDHIKYLISNSKTNFRELMERHLIFLNLMNNMNRVVYYDVNYNKIEKQFRDLFNISTLQFIRRDVAKLFPKFAICEYTMSCQQLSPTELPLDEKKMKLIQTLMPREFLEEY
jgi:predicted GTPase